MRPRLSEGYPDGGLNARRAKTGPRSFTSTVAGSTEERPRRTETSPVISLRAPAPMPLFRIIVPPPSIRFPLPFETSKPAIADCLTAESPGPLSRETRLEAIWRCCSCPPKMSSPRWARSYTRRSLTSRLPARVSRRERKQIGISPGPRRPGSFDPIWGAVDPKNPLASPLYADLSGLPPVRVHVGNDEVLLDDSRRYVEKAVAAGVDAKLHLWMGMLHGFVTNAGRFNAATQALSASGAFLAERLRGTRRAEHESRQ